MSETTQTMPGFRITTNRFSKPSGRVCGLVVTHLDGQRKCLAHTTLLSDKAPMLQLNISKRSHTLESTATIATALMEHIKAVQCASAPEPSTP